MNRTQKLQLRQTLGEELDLPEEDRTEGRVGELTRELRSMEQDLQDALLVQGQDLPADRVDSPKDH